MRRVLVFITFFLILNKAVTCLGMQSTTRLETTPKDIAYLELLQRQVTLLRKQVSATQIEELRALGHRVSVGFDLALAAIDYNISKALATKNHTACFAGAQALVDVLNRVALCNLADYYSDETKTSLLYLAQKTMKLYQQAHQGWLAAPPGAITQHNLLALCSSEQEALINSYLHQILSTHLDKIGDLAMLFVTMRYRESNILKD